MRGVEPSVAVRVAEALYEGGIKLVEITFNQKDKSNKTTSEGLSYCFIL